tara:strand:+ start:4266 stop:4694 length:429 start_codon:yes stop_codon:yes gene_type:complete
MQYPPFQDMPWALWLDDIRNPSVYFDALGYTMIEEVKDLPVLWARDVEQAVYFVKSFGTPQFMCLDHDLGVPAYSNTPEKSTKFLGWLANYVNLVKPIPYRTHSDNPEGCKSVVAFLESWYKSSLLPGNEHAYQALKNEEEE